MRTRLLLQKQERPQVKICGITTPEDAQMVAESGAAAIGLNFYPGSKRYVTLQKAEKIVESAGPGMVRVAVTVNADFDVLSSIWEKDFVDMFQFHGSEDSEYLRTVQKNGWPFFVARRVRTAEEARHVINDMSSLGIPAILFDAWVDGAFGGTGESIDLQILTNLFTRNTKMTYILAGGLHAGNVANAIRTLQPHFVDVASGVEDQPGRKSRSKVQAFLEAVESA